MATIEQLQAALKGAQAAGATEDAAALQRFIAAKTPEGPEPPPPEAPQTQAQAAPQAPAEAPSAVQSFGRGAVKGATLGLSTPAAGGGAAAASWAVKHLPGVMQALGYETRYQNELPAPGEAFQEAAAKRAAEDKAAEEAHGGAFLGGELAGGLLPSMVGGGGLGRQVAQGAVQGGISGAAGASPTGDVGDIVGSGLLGGAVGAGGGALPSVLGAAAKGVRNIGERAGFHSLGMVGAQAKALAKQGAQKLEDVRTLLREAPEQLGITLGGKPSEAVKRLGAMKEQAGKAVGDIVDTINNEAVGVTKNRVGKMLQAQIDALEHKAGVSDDYVNALQNERASILRHGEDFFTPKDIHETMKEISPRALSIYENVTGAERAKASAAADTRKLLEGILDKQAEAAGVGNEFASTNALYGALARIHKQAFPRAALEDLGNKTLGHTGSTALGTIIGGLGLGAGAVMGGPQGGGHGLSAEGALERAPGALLGLAGALAARRGLQLGGNVSAIAAPKLAGTLEALQRGLQAPATSAVRRSLTNAIAARAPEAIE